MNRAGSSLQCRIIIQLAREDCHISLPAVMKHKNKALFVFSHSSCFIVQIQESLLQLDKRGKKYLNGQWECTGFTERECSEWRLHMRVHENMTVCLWVICHFNISLCLKCLEANFIINVIKFDLWNTKAVAGIFEEFWILLLPLRPRHKR